MMTFKYESAITKSNIQKLNQTRDLTCYRQLHTQR